MRVFGEPRPTVQVVFNLSVDAKTKAMLDDSQAKTAKIIRDVAKGQTSGAIRDDDGELVGNYQFVTREDWKW